LSGFCLLTLLSVAVTAIDSSAAWPVILATVDYPRAVWVPAAATNYTVANRPDDYPIDMIVIHDIEGSYASAIKMFQDPKRLGSAHYIVSYKGQVTQMVAENNIAWHAGNWDYNTRSIGIEHEGYAAINTYTSREYYASARVAASICSRWGVPLDRKHVIGHSQVPDPNNPKLFGGSDHHTDPGPYWNWTGYLALAQAYAKALPSPPHMMFEASAFSGDGTATVHWQPAHTCRTAIASYDVVLEPGNLQMTVPGTTTSASFTGLTNGVNYSFTVTAHNAYGDDSVGSNFVTPGTVCTSASLAAGLAAPQSAGVPIRFTATSTGCANPQYQFSIQDANGNWVIQQTFGGSSWNWDTYHFAPGSHTLGVWANHATADPSQPEAFAEMTYETTAFSMSHWQAKYDTSKVPTTWVIGRSQTFPVTVTNIGDVTWPATGHSTVDLDLHFAPAAGGSAKQSTWLNSKAFAMPADLGPGASVTMNVTFAAPARTGALVLEAEMVKEQDFWYQQWQPVSVNVASLDKAASYDMSNVPVSWSAGKSQTFAVTVTNTSNQTWLSTGTYRTDLDLHFAPAAGGSAKQSTWLSSKAFSLPANLAAGGSVTLNLTFTAPSKVGSFVLEAEMVKEHQYWFQNWQAVKVTVN
jgi:N-acetyl-anhydromuramyl-L-alanine amidase AmpD/acyl-coenzyme A thioesterase PaaI-like protein